MADLLAISSRIIDSGVVDQPVNRTTSEFSEIGDGIAVVESFSHCVLFSTDDGVVAFDASGPATGTRVMDAIRGWTQQPVSTIVYTHGHIDHVGGSGAFAADAEARGHARPEVVAHEAVAPRFDRYRYTNGYNNAINHRQFGWQRNRDVGIAAARPEQQFLPADTLSPDRTYAEHLELAPGGITVELHHGRGETDDHTWAWVPQHKAVCVGDFSSGTSPMPAIRRRCSVTRASGPPRCAPWWPKVPNCCCPRTASPSKGRTASLACSPPWPLHSRTCWPKW